ncbi:MAG: sulfur carrier protein ThiS [Thermostichus sp. DG_1_5_bins_95]
MRVWINQEPHELPEGMTLADAVATAAVNAPFAVAVNQEFIPRSRYAETSLREGDRVEIVAPTVGG